MVTNALPGQHEPVVDRYRRWNPVWYRWLKPLLEQVVETAKSTEGNAVQIVQTNEVVDGIKANVTTEIRGTAGNYQVVGLVSLSSEGAISDFTVVADKIKFAHPDDENNIINMMVIQLVAGVSTMSLNGDLLVDGIIKAPMLESDAIRTQYVSDNANTYYFDFENGKLGRVDGNMTIDLSTGLFEIGVIP